MADWQKIKTEYITTDTSYRKLASKYGITYTIIGKRAKKEGWPEEKQRWIDDTTTKILDAVGDEHAASTAKKICEVADKILSKIEEMVDSIELSDMSARTLQALTAAVKNIKEIKGVRSQLDVDEQEARIANLRKQAQNDDDTGEIEVVFDAGEDEWNE